MKGLIDVASPTIDGAAVTSGEGRSMPVVNPATEEPLAEIPIGDAETVDRAVQAADSAFGRWSETTPR